MFATSTLLIVYGPTSNEIVKISAAPTVPMSSGIARPVG